MYSEFSIIETHDYRDSSLEIVTSFLMKVQFFKIFILPYFDYCLSLIIYFHKSCIQRLANCYYLCLFKLFNFKFSSDDPAINEYLKNLNS